MSDMQGDSTRTACKIPCERIRACRTAGRNREALCDLGGDRGALGQGSGDSTTGRGGKEATSEGVFKLAATVGRWNLILLGDTG